MDVSAAIAAWMLSPVNPTSPLYIGNPTSPLHCGDDDEEYSLTSKEPSRKVFDVFRKKKDKTKQ